MFFVGILMLFSSVFAHDLHTDVFDDVQIAKDCVLAGFTERVSLAQLRVAQAMFASREHRLQHSLWHAMRSNLTSAERKQAVKTYGADWEKFHPLCPPPQNNASSSTYNPAGEDFFYMHHQMVMMYFSALLAAHQKCVTAWTTIPDPRDWPVPGTIQNSKTEEALEQLQDWDRQIQSGQWLRQVSLSQLGWALEFTIHNNLHTRYAEDRPAARYRSSNGVDGAVIPLDARFPRSWRYDELGYNWLTDPYASATNPVFWKIHGYVDHILFSWLEAHGKNRAAVDCGSDPKCYTWRGTWTGNLPTLSPRAPMLSSANPASTANDADFLRKRLANQRLGEIKSGVRVLPGGTHSSTQDILSTARASVCP